MMPEPVTNFSHRRVRSNGSQNSASGGGGRAPSGALVIRKTFIDVDTDDRASSLSPRASSDPGSESSHGFFYEAEQTYLTSLQERWESSPTGGLMPFSLPVSGGGELGDSLAHARRPDEQVTPCSVSSVELRTQLEAKTRVLTKSLLNRGHREALTVIHELPEQVGDMLLETATRMVDNVNSEVAAMQTIIDEDGHNVGPQLQGIPEMIMDSFEASAEKAKDSVRSHVEGLAGMESKALVDEMRKIPDQVQQIAERALQRAVETSHEQAEQQLDAVLYNIQEESAELRKLHNAKMRVLNRIPAVVHDSEDAASVLVAGTVEQAVAAVQQKEVLESTIANRLVADTLLRAKVGQDVTESITQAGVNPGSIGHPELCPRPCLYFASGNCSNGLNCDFCHMTHEKRPAHLDKRHRSILQRMPFNERVALVLPMLKQKVQTLTLGPLVADSLDFLEEHAKQVPSPPPSSNKQHRSLLIAMNNMSIRALLTCLHRSATAQSPGACKDIHALIRQLRCQSFMGSEHGAASSIGGGMADAYSSDGSP